MAVAHVLQQRRAAGCAADVALDDVNVLSIRAALRLQALGRVLATQVGRRDRVRFRQFQRDAPPFRGWRL